MTREQRKLQKSVEEKRRWHESRRERETGAGERAIVAGVDRAACRLDGHPDPVRTRGFPVVPGDEVLHSPRGIEGILPRRSELARGRHIIAANVDTVVVVSSFGAPPLRPGLIDRYLVAIRRGGAEPLLCVNKSDRRTAAELALLEPYTALVPVLLCSALTGEGLAALRDRLCGQTCVLSGHSGTGKSSLVNALAPGLNLRTGAVEEKGRHTTTASSLHHLGDGIRLIDTPGIREFAVDDVEPEEFPEFDRFAPFCRFRDCTHTHEPACAVREAAAGGLLPRYAAYRRLREAP